MNEKYYCTNCGRIVNAQPIKESSPMGCVGGFFALLLFVPIVFIACIFPIFWIGVVLYLVILVAFRGGGIGKGTYRLHCPACHAENTLVPTDSPRAKEVMETDKEKKAESTPQDIAGRLATLKKLFDEGVVAAEEYEAQRRSIIGEI